MIKYKIAWKAIETGATGAGQPVFGIKEAAQGACEELNIIHKGSFIHWVEAVEVPEEE